MPRRKKVKTEEMKFDIPDDLMDHPTNYSTPADATLALGRVNDIKKGDVIVLFKKDFKDGNVKFGIMEGNFCVINKSADKITLSLVGKERDLGPKQKERLANEITAMVEKDIKKDIVDVVKESLKESKGGLLKKLKEKLKRGKKARVIKKRGCVYLNVDGSEVYL